MRSNTGWFKGSCALASIWATATVSWGHSGHAIEVVSDGSPLHYVLQPEHAAGWVLLAVAIATGFWLHRSARRRQLKQLVRVKK